jgi:hypothetical protein
MDGEDGALLGIHGHPRPVHVRAAEGLEPGEVLQQLVLPDQRLVELEEVRVGADEGRWPADGCLMVDLEE